MFLEERERTAQEIVRRVEESLRSPDGLLKEAVLDFRKEFLRDVQDGCVVEVWAGVFDTLGWQWLERNDVPVLVRQEQEHVFVYFLDGRLETWKAN